MPSHGRRSCLWCLEEIARTEQIPLAFIVFPAAPPEHLLCTETGTVGICNRMQCLSSGTQQVDEKDVLPSKAAHGGTCGDTRAQAELGWAL